MTLLLRRDAGSNYSEIYFFEGESEAEDYLVNVAIESWDCLHPVRDMPKETTDIIDDFYGEQNSGRLFEIIPNVEEYFPNHRNPSITERSSNK